MTLRLRPDLSWTAVPDGLYLVAPGVRARLRGRSIAAWFERLRPGLAGDHTLAQLTAGLPEARRAQIEAIVTALLDCGALATAESGRPGPPGPERLGERSVVIVAADPMRSALIEASALAGAGPDRYAGSEPPPGTGSGRWLVWHVTDPRDTAHVDRWCRGRDVLLARIAVAGGRAWLHVSAGPDAPQRWAAAWRRRVGLGAGPDGPEPEVTPDTATVLANQAVRAVLHQLGGPAPENPGVTALELDGLRSATHRVLPHPFAAAVARPDGAAVAESVRRLAARPALSPDDFSRQAAAATDPVFGLLADIEESDFPQTPLHVAQCRVADPVGLAGAAAGRPVTGRGATYEEARLHTALNGLARYASRMVDPRRLTDTTGRPACTGDPDAALRRVRRRPDDYRTWGCHLVTGEPALVPAATLFPLLGPSGPGWSGSGPVAGYGWAPVVLDGLIRALRAGHDGPAAQYAPLDGVPLTERGQHHLRILRALGEPVEYTAGTGPAGVVVAAVRHGRRPPHQGLALSLGPALEQALELALLAGQARAYGRAGDVRALGGPAPGRSTDGDPGTDLAELAGRLHRSGVDPFVVPLPHDPAAAAVNPFVAAVVLHG
jgi:hypothetical protein